METGIVRNVDRLGRIVIPSPLRKMMKIKAEEPLEIRVENDEIILRKYRPPADACALCGDRSGKKVIHIKTGKILCTDCSTSLLKPTK